MCSTPPWSSDCMGALAYALEAGDTVRLRSWIDNHIDRSLDSWIYLVTAVVTLGSELVTKALHAAAPASADIVFAPGGDATLTQAERDAEQVTAMVLNEDWPGLTGLMAALHERDAITETVASVMAYATTMLQFEAHLEGRSS